MHLVKPWTVGGWLVLAASLGIAARRVVESGRAGAHASDETLGAPSSVGPVVGAVPSAEAPRPEPAPSGSSRAHTDVGGPGSEPTGSELRAVPTGRAAERLRASGLEAFVDGQGLHPEVHDELIETIRSPGDDVLAAVCARLSEDEGRAPPADTWRELAAAMVGDRLCAAAKARVVGASDERRVGRLCALLHADDLVALFDLLATREERGLFSVDDWSLLVRRAPSTTAWSRILAFCADGRCAAEHRQLVFNLLLLAVEARPSGPQQDRLWSDLHALLHAVPSVEARAWLAQPHVRDSLAEPTATWVGEFRVKAD